MGANRGIIENCETMCGEIFYISHIFQCKILNPNINNLYIENILSGDKNMEIKHGEKKHHPQEPVI